MICTQFMYSILVLSHDSPHMIGTTLIRLDSPYMTNIRVHSPHMTGITLLSLDSPYTTSIRVHSPYMTGITLLRLIVHT